MYIYIYIEFNHACFYWCSTYSIFFISYLTQSGQSSITNATMNFINIMICSVAIRMKTFLIGFPRPMINIYSNYQSDCLVTLHS